MLGSNEAEISTQGTKVEWRRLKTTDRLASDGAAVRENTDGKLGKRSRSRTAQGVAKETRTFILGFMGSLGFGLFGVFGYLGILGMFVGLSKGVCTLTQLRPLKMRMSIKSIFCNFRESLLSSRRRRRRRRRRRLAHRPDN